MTIDQNAFETPTAPVVTLEDQLKAITNADGTPKYADVNTALEGLKASQEHIAKLEKEAAEKAVSIEALAKKASEATALEEIVAKLKEPKENPVQTPAVGGLDEDSAKQLFSNMLQEQNQRSAQEANFNQVNDALMAKYGEKAAATVTAKAQELGMTVDDMMRQAQSHPKSVLAYFAATGTPAPAPVTPSQFVNEMPPKESSNDELFKGILSGPNSNQGNLRRAMESVRAEVYAKHGITT